MSKGTSEKEPRVEYERPKFRAVSESDLFAGYGQESYGAAEQQNAAQSYYAYPYYYPAYHYDAGCWPQTTAQAAPDESGSRTPVCEMRDEDGSYSLAVELPGAEPDEIDVYVGDNEVEVTTDPAGDDKSEDNSSRRFYGSLTLPQEIDPEGTETRFANGVLYIKLAKVKPPTPKHIKVGGTAAPKVSTRAKKRK